MLTVYNILINYKTHYFLVLLQIPIKISFINSKRLWHQVVYQN